MSVRVRPGTPKSPRSSVNRASGYEPEGHRFESCRGGQLGPCGGMADTAVSETVAERRAGSTPAKGTIFASVVEWADTPDLKSDAARRAGSSPARSTIFASVTISAWTGVLALWAAWPI